MSDVDIIDRTIDRAVAWLVGQQHEDGRWMGALETNSCMEAQWVLAMHVLGVADDPKYDGVVRAIRREQRADGSWEVYRDAPTGDINATVECYAALRAAGADPAEPALVRARDWIAEHGGLGATRVFTRYWLALVGEWPWASTPSLPPEIIWLPTWFPLNLYAFASWARATILPLALLRARCPVVPLAAPLDELHPDGRERADWSLPPARDAVGVGFHLIDRLLSVYDALPWQPGRAAARRACVEWIVRHQDADGAWGGIQPPWIYALMALRFEGYPLHHPVLAAGLAAFDGPTWRVERGDAVYLQASESSVWDTLLSSLALIECGRGDHPAVDRALAWWLPREVRVAGDWAMTVDAEPSGWAFESYNDHYPDVDDTAVALLVLSHLRERVDGLEAPIARALAWVRALHCRGGGWAAFDRDNDSPLAARIPFSDFGEALDPPSADVTAHVVEALAALGVRDETLSRAVAYLNAEQERDGSWFGRWGVNHIYGTGAVLPALAAAGVAMDAPGTRAAARWIREHQNADGGWGETCASYMDASLRGVGESTASQTAWALMALIATGAPEHAEAVARGVEWLARTQTDAGSWNEPQYTGTGFPGYGFGARLAPERALDQGTELARGFMLRYGMYSHYFPLIALGRAREYLAMEPEPPVDRAGQAAGQAATR